MDLFLTCFSCWLTTTAAAIENSPTSWCESSWRVFMHWRGTRTRSRVVITPGGGWVPFLKYILTDRLCAHFTWKSLTQFFLDGNKEEDGDDGSTQRRLTVRVIEWLIASVCRWGCGKCSQSLSLALLVSLLFFVFCLHVCELPSTFMTTSSAPDSIKRRERQGVPSIDQLSTRFPSLTRCNSLTNSRMRAESCKLALAIG